MQTLENNKAFPYIAWTTVILFSILTFSLVQNLKTTLGELDTQIEITATAAQKR